MAVRSRLTKEGKVVALLGVGFLLGALNTGTNLLYLITGVIAAALWLDRRLAGQAASAVRVRRPAPDPGVAGEPLAVHLLVEADAGTLAPVLVEERVEGPALDPAAPPRALVLELPPGGRAAARARGRCVRRGRALLPGPRVTAHGPFGLVAGERDLDLPAEALVLPRVRALRPGALERAPAPPTEALARRLAFTPERRDAVRGLRELRPGDDVRAVHWRSSARRGALLVKEFERTAPREARLLVRLPAGASDDAVEAAVAVAAAVAAHVVRQGERLALAVAGAGPPAAPTPGEGEAALRRALEALAVAAAGEADLAAADQATRRAAGAARTVVVTAGDPVEARLPGALVLAVGGEADAGRLLRPEERPT